MCATSMHAETLSYIFVGAKTGNHKNPFIFYHDLNKRMRIETNLTAVRWKYEAEEGRDIFRYACICAYTN